MKVQVKHLLYWLSQIVFGTGLIGGLWLIHPADSLWVFLSVSMWFACALYSWVRYGPSLRDFIWRGPPPWYAWLMARRNRQ